MTIQIDFKRALHDMEYHDAAKKATFGPYSPTYVFATNENPDEDIKRYMYNEKDKRYCKKVLTMSSSGDQPLCCKRYNVNADITTFDWTYTSKIMMDIKTFSIKTLNFGEYMQLLKSLYNNPNITSLPNFEGILSQLDPTEQEYIHIMDGKFALFNFGPAPREDRLAKIYWQELIHKDLQSVDLSPFPFIWSDIAHLDAKLGNNKYDFIHLSNIFDFVSEDVKVSVLEQLTKRLNYDGRILMCVTDYSDYKLEDICKNIEKQSNDLKYINHQYKMLLLKYR